METKAKSIDPLVNEYGEVVQIKSALSLVANGMRCLFLTEFLAQLESETKSKTRDLFGVLAGTSSGALVAAALNQGVPASEIGEAFVNSAPRIYRKHPFPISLTGNWFKSSYDQKALRELVTALVGDKPAQLTMDKVEGRLLLTIWDLESHSQYDLVSKSLYSSQTDSDVSSELALADALIASMATPGKFVPVSLSGTELVDASTIVSPITRLSSALEDIGVDSSALNILSLRAAHPIAYGGNTGRSNQRISGIFAKIKTQKAVFDSLPELTARKAAVDAHDRLGERFQEYHLELGGGLEFQPESYQQEHLEAIKKAARHEFERFISDDNWNRFQKKIS